VRQAFTIIEVEYVYLGVIQAQPQHTVGITVIDTPDLPRIVYPFKYLTKSHIIDLYFKMGIQELLQYTNSCEQQQPCGVCNGCREREWGLAECGITQ
jgi:7-cyano-7-deazaguanine synthase in queuosine biosynthesis